MRSPSSEGVVSEVGEPRNLFPLLGVGRGMLWGRLELAFGGNRRWFFSRVVSPAEGAGALAPARFLNSLHACVDMDRHVFVIALSAPLPLLPTTGSDRFVLLFCAVSCCLSPVVDMSVRGDHGSGAAKRRRERRLRMHRRHEQLTLRMVRQTTATRTRAEERETSSAPQRQEPPLPAVTTGRQYFMLDECVPVMGLRPTGLVEPRGPQERLQRHTMEQFGELAPTVQILDGGCAEDRRPLCSRAGDRSAHGISCPPPRRVLPEPQSAEQLVEVPTVLSPVRTRSRWSAFQFLLVVASGVFKVFSQDRVQQGCILVRNAFLSGLWSRSLISPFLVETFLLVEVLTVFSPDRVLQRLPVRMLTFWLVEVFTVYFQDRVSRRFLDLHTAKMLLGVHAEVEDLLGVLKAPSQDRAPGLLDASSYCLRQQGVASSTLTRVAEFGDASFGGFRVPVSWQEHFAARAVVTFSRRFGGEGLGIPSPLLGCHFWHHVRCLRAA